MTFSINKLLDSIRRGIVTNAEAPVEIRDDTILDKLLMSDDEPGNYSPHDDLWPPYYRNSKWWTYIWYLKDEKNRDEFAREHNLSPDDVFVPDRFVYLHAVYRAVNRLLRLGVWCLYSLLGRIYSWFRGNHRHQEARVDLSHSSKLNALILFGGMAVCIYVLVAMVKFFLTDVMFFHPETFTTPSGTIVIKQPCGVEQDMLVHSTSQLWNDTGIELMEGDEVEICYSGSFHSSIHELETAAGNHNYLEHSLIDAQHPAERLPKNDADTCGTSKTLKYCVYNEQDATFGSLLFQVVPHGKPCMSHSRGYYKSTDSIEYSVKQADLTHGKYRFTATHNGTLRLAVNDVYLTNEIFHQILKDNNIARALKYKLLNRMLCPITADYELHNFDTVNKIWEMKRREFATVFPNNHIDSIVQDINQKILKNKFAIINKNACGSNAAAIHHDIDSTRRKNVELNEELKATDAMLLATIMTEPTKIDLLQWDSPLLWYNDNVGDLLVNVTVIKKHDDSWYSFPHIYRTLEGHWWHMIVGIIIISLVLMCIDRLITYWAHVKRFCLRLINRCIRFIVRCFSI